MTGKRHIKGRSQRQRSRFPWYKTQVDKTLATRFGRGRLASHLDKLNILPEQVVDRWSVRSWWSPENTVTLIRPVCW